MAASMRTRSAFDVSGPTRKRGERPTTSSAEYPVVFSNAGLTKRMRGPGSSTGLASVTMTMSFSLSRAAPTTSDGNAVPIGFRAAERIA